MTIKPVLVPDQDAATLRKLMDAFADASTGPTRQELTESRAAVAAAPGVAEGLGKDTSGTFVDRVVGEIMNYQSLNDTNPKFADLSSAVKSKLKSLGEIKAKQIYQQALKQAAELSGQQGVAEGILKEFAPSDSGGDDGDDGFDEDTLRKLAAQWFAGDEDPQVERLLAAAGWEIGQDEGYDDEPGVFVVQSGDADGRSYISWPAEELRSDVAEATMSRAAKGYEKYGKEGMQALARAGREGRALDPVRQKYDRYDETAESGITEDAENNPVINAITRRIMMQRTDLLSKYGPEQVGQAVDEVADFVGDVEEIGSSDVSGWVRHVEQMLGNMESDVAEQQVDELSPKTLGSYIKKSSADAAERQGDVTGSNQFGKGAEFAVKAFYGDRIKPNPTRTDPRIAKRQAGIDQAVDRLTAEDVAPAFKPGDRVMYLTGFATVVAQDGDAYGIRIDGKPGTQMVPADQIRKPSYDESVAESIDPVEQLRADIRRFAL